MRAYKKGTRFNLPRVDNYPKGISRASRDKITVPTSHKIAFDKLAIIQKYIIKLPRFLKLLLLSRTQWLDQVTDRTGNLSNFWVILRARHLKTKVDHRKLPLTSPPPLPLINPPGFALFCKLRLCYLDLKGTTKFKYERKTKWILVWVVVKKSSCKWHIVQ